MAQQLSDLRLESQQRANQESKTLILTPEWNRYINEAIAELYDTIIAVNPHYYVSSTQFTLAGSNAFALTSLSPIFYKLRGVDYLPSGVVGTRPVTVRPFNFAERNRYSNTQNFQGTYTVWWTPPPPVLVADGDTLDIILDVWAEFVPVTVAIAAAVKEDSGELASNLTEIKQGIKERIAKAAPNRDGEPGQAADLMWGQSDCGRRYSLEGANLLILGSSTSVWDWV